MSISVLEGLFERGRKNTITIMNSTSRRGIPDVHLDVQFSMVIVLGLSLNKTPHLK